MKREGGQECLCVLLFRRVAGIIHHSPLLPASCLEADNANRVKGLPSPLASCFLAFWLLLGCGCWEAHLGDWRAEDSEVSISHPFSKGLSSAGGFSTGLGLGRIFLHSYRLEVATVAGAEGSHLSGCPVPLQIVLVL